MAIQASASAPAPWHLKGNGFILLYYFGKHFLNEKGFMSEFQKKNLQLNLGAVMLMDYQSADVGPYQELLFIPGLFSFGDRRSFSVSKIYVSSPESQWKGQRNWGLPKELAGFKVQELSDGRSRWTVTAEDQPFFQATLKTRAAALPFSSSLVPWSRIVQQAGNRLLLTAPTASGNLQLAALEDISAAPAFFPPVQEATLIAAFNFRKFRMKFPVPWHLG